MRRQHPTRQRTSHASVRKQEEPLADRRLGWAGAALYVGMVVPVLR